MFFQTTIHKSLNLSVLAALSLLPPSVLNAQTVSWVPEGPPLARGNAAIAYDGATRSTLLFGGANNARVFGDTWSWSDGWHPVYPAHSPSPRTGAAMAFDSAANNVVLFGGSTTYGVSPQSSLGDTWTWDGTNWAQQFPPVSPPARVYAGIAYDSLTKSVLLFGGANMAGGAGAFGDTWAWDGVAKTWTQLSPANSPSPRAASSLVYDEAHGTIVLFGGVISNLVNLDDTWTWDGTNWKQQFPISSPSPRNGPALAYDSGLQAVVLFGGAVGACWRTASTTCGPGAAAPGTESFRAGVCHTREARPT